MTFILLGLVALLAFVNGANDNCKGVATLVGYGAATPRKALIWAAISTAVGAAVSYWAAAGLIKAFSGAGLFPSGTTLEANFFLATLIGAVGWIALATFTGLPVSTTHAITGGLCGAGILSFGAATVQWNILGQRFALPLALSPMLSLATVYLLAFPIVFVISRYAARCACVTNQAMVPAGNLSAVAIGAAPAIVIDDEQNCEGATGVKGSVVANGVHWITAGMVGFARGWNDAPKIAALAIGSLAAANLGGAIAFVVVTVAMAAGGLLAGRKVLETLSKKVTTMPLAESLTASAVTASLVSLASWNALPVSTTHVSTGAIIGAGLKHDARGVRWSKVSQIVLSWIVTLPVAAGIAAVTAWII